MVNNCEQSSISTDLHTTQSFLNQSKAMSKKVQQEYSNLLPTHSELLEEEQAKEDLPCFGSTIKDVKFEDPFEEEHQELARMLEKINSDTH